MLNCSQVTRSIASDGYRTGGFLHRLSVRMHLAMCRHCSRYFRQLRALGNVFREMGDAFPISDVLAARDRLVARISRKP